MRKIISIFTIFISAAVLFAQNSKIEDFVPAEYLEQLKKNGVVEIIHEKEDTNLNLIPNCKYASDVEAEKIEKNEKQVPFVAEYLYLVPKNDGDDSVVPGIKGTIDDVSVLFRSISKMKGMKYHFEKSKPETLYKKAYVIANKDSDEPIPDPIEGSADGLVAYCYQDDNTYGDMKYKLSYKQSDNIIFANFLLITTMSYIGIKAVDPENMKINIIAIECDDCYILYLNTDVAARKIAIANVRKQIKDSMTVRMEAVYRWFLALL